MLSIWSYIFDKGAGLLGVYGCALLAEKGCSVFCSDISDSRLSIVKKFGATSVKDTSGSLQYNFTLVDKNITNVQYPYNI